MINLTDAWRKAGKVRSKSPNTWAGRKASKRLIEQAGPNGMRIVLGRSGFTEAVPEIAAAYMKFLSSAEISAEEAAVEKVVAAKLKARTQVKTPIGRIDILTKTIIGEIKLVRSWKSALGQIIAYGYYYPGHQKKLYLFGQCRPSLRPIILLVCANAGVTVDFI